MRRDDQLLAAILDGLARDQRELPSALLWDEVGEALFHTITTTPEYYPTRTETAILEENAAEISAAIGEGALLVEPGAGRCEKVRPLLPALRLAAYVPVDVVGPVLRAAADDLRAAWPALPVLPVVSDYGAPIVLPDVPAARRAVFFPGSTIGNFEPAAAMAWLSELATLAGADGRLVIGVDLRKEVARLRAAYDDAAGVTARFDRNALVHLARRWGARVDPAGFDHEARWNEPKGRIEMHLVANGPQRVEVGGRRFDLAAGESIRTECCHKWTIPAFQALAGEAGWRPLAAWTDPRRDFAVLAFAC